MSIVEVNFSHSENETFTGNLEYSIVDILIFLIGIFCIQKIAMKWILRMIDA